MLSIIICSISQERLAQITQNIYETIGIECEIISIDNREKNLPIANVYNEGARKARYPFLFFVHEDVKFHSQNWGKIIEEKLKEPNCGVIGFCGSKIKFKIYSGWPEIPSVCCNFLYQRIGEKAIFVAYNAYLEHPFEEVIALDGLGMFVTKELWAKYPFDEQNLTGFHCYDLDFSMQIAQTKKYKNYVCTTPAVIIEHFSLGNLDEKWIENVIRMHKNKWNSFLPLQTSDSNIGRKKKKAMEEKCFYLFIEKMLKSNYPNKWSILKEYLFFQFSWKHLINSIKSLFAFTIANIKHKK